MVFGKWEFEVFNVIDLIWIVVDDLLSVVSWFKMVVEVVFILFFDII